MIPLSMPRAVAVRAMAQALSAALVFVALLFAFDAGVPPVWSYSGTELTHFLLSACMVGGLALGLVNPPLGGVVTWAAFVAFWGSHTVATGGERLGGAFALFPIAATLLLSAWWLERRARAVVR